ncbi:MAG: hypothetical protein R3314_13230, partial [Longimicrobiales bacterium]|nr:hypothetical protein [Longimicrobiales bacterium]
MPRSLPTLAVLTAVLAAVLAVPTAVPTAAQEHTRADTLRGTVGPERVWWDVTFYDLHVAVSPTDSTITGRVGIVFEVTEPAPLPGAPRTMQIDLQQPLAVDSITRRGARLEYDRDGNVVWVPVPGTRVGG